MLKSPARSSLLVLALSLATAGAAAATPGPGGAASDGVTRRLTEGLRLLERMLHLQQPGTQVVGHGISLSPHEAALQLDLASGAEYAIALRDGEVVLNGQRIAGYAVGGRLDLAWRRFLASAASTGERDLLAQARHWEVRGLGGEELAAQHRIASALADFSAEPPLVPPTAPRPVAVASADSAAEAAPVPALPVPDIEAPAVPASAPAAATGPAAIEILFTGVKNVVALFIALAMIGFGAVFFARRYLEVVADTASESFGRSLVVGLLGQLLLLPTLAMLIVGLIFTIVGILLLPFAVIAFVIGVCVAVLGGYLAVAHAIGESVSRRRMANGLFVRSPNAYGYLFTGLVGLLGLWAAAALFGWAGPVVYVFRAAAFVVTWLAATVGFGAMLLSRAGLRDTFAGRHMGEQTGEYLWATPPATPVAPRPGRRE
jgi:hypothetical protein